MPKTPIPREPRIAVTSEYPKTLAHPAYTPAVISTGATPGAPGRFQPVIVNNPDQEEEYRAKGWVSSKPESMPTRPPSTAQYVIPVPKPELLTLLEAIAAPEIKREIKRIASAVLGDLPEPLPRAADDDPARKGPPGLLPARHAKRGVSKASPKDARDLFKLFVECIEHGLISAHTPAAEHILEYVKCAGRSFIDRDRPTLDAAFGVARSERGRPPDPDKEGKEIGIAVDILRLRLGGLNEKAAIKKYGSTSSAIRPVWKTRKVEALRALAAERAMQKRPWTEKENAEIRRIYKTTKKGGHILTKDGCILPKGGWTLDNGRLVPPPDSA